MSRFPARRALRRAGVDVELYNFEQAEAADSRGQPWSQTDASPQTIDAIADPGGKSVSYGTFGVEVDADQVYLVDADLVDACRDRLDPTGYKVLLEIAARAPVQEIHEVGFQFREREHGDSNLGPREYARYVAHLGRLLVPARRESVRVVDAAEVSSG